MMLRYTALDDVEEQHLTELVELGVPEIRFVEYKSELPGNSEAQGKEFVSDVCSFANAGGGDLIFGVEEEGGTPTALSGVPMPDPDREVLRLESMILAGIDPRPPGFQSRYVPLSNDSHALVLRIPRSFNRPHAVDYKGRFRFYSRNSAGKYEMDVAEIRGAVLASETVADRLRSFRASRLADIVAGEVPLETGDVATVVLHVLPLAAFDLPAPSVDLAEALRFPESLLPIGMGGDLRYTFDGLLCHGANRAYGGTEEKRPESYALLFRSGTIEAADSLILWPAEYGPRIPSHYFESQVLKAVHKYIALLRHLSVGGPVYVALSLLGVRGYEMGYESVYYSSIKPIDRDALIISEAMTEGVGLNRPEIERLMRPVLDQVWNACGYPASPFYDEASRWVGDPRFA